MAGQYKSGQGEAIVVPDQRKVRLGPQLGRFDHFDGQGLGVSKRNSKTEVLRDARSRLSKEVSPRSAFAQEDRTKRTEAKAC